MAPREMGTRKEKASQTILKARAKPRAKAIRVKKPESVTSEATNLDICARTVRFHKKRVEGGNKGKTETTAAVQGATAAMQGAMIETREYTEDNCVCAFGEVVIAAFHRPETHICIDSGASRSVCPSGYAPDVSKGTAPSLFSTDGSCN